MPRVLQFGNYGVFVYDERGSRHHLPHAHVKLRRHRVASVYLLSGVFYYVVADLPGELVEMIHAELGAMLETWTELNGD
jgi:hypothetical protein